MKLFPAACILALVLSPAGAADWPMGGRGPDRNAVSPGKDPPTDWQLPAADAKPRNVCWSARVGTRAIGGPVVSGGLVWVGTNNESRDGDTPDFAVLACFRESDGTPLYRYLSPRLGGFPDDWPRQGLSGSPLAEGDRLWFCTNRREIVCLDTGPLRRGTGDPAVLWKLDMVKTLGVRPRAVMIPGPDMQGSPTAYKDFLYAPTGNGVAADGRTVPAPAAPSLVCVRKDTGKVVWSDHSPGKNLLCGQIASPLVVEVGGRPQAIHPQGDGWVRSFDALTGKPLWAFDTNRKDAAPRLHDLGDAPPRTFVMATPVFAGGRVYVATGLDPEGSFGPGRLFCLDPTRSGDVSPELPAGPGQGKPNPNSAVVWEFTRAGPKEEDRMHLTTAAVAVAAGLVVAPDDRGFVHCLDAATGKRHWVHDAGSRTVSGPLIAGGKIVLAAEGGDVWVFNLDKVKTVVAKRDADARITAPVVFANDTLFVLTETTLHAIAVPRK